MKCSLVAAKSRKVNVGGTMIDGLSIPEGFDVGIGIHSIHHEPACSPEPVTDGTEVWLNYEEQTADIETMRLHAIRNEPGELHRQAFCTYEAYADNVDTSVAKSTFNPAERSEYWTPRQPAPSSLRLTC